MPSLSYHLLSICFESSIGLGSLSKRYRNKEDGYFRSSKKRVIIRSTNNVALELNWNCSVDGLSRAWGASPVASLSATVPDPPLQPILTVWVLVWALISPHPEDCMCLSHLPPAPPLQPCSRWPQDSSSTLISLCHTPPQQGEAQTPSPGSWGQFFPMWPRACSPTFPGASHAQPPSQWGLTYCFPKHSTGLPLLCPIKPVKFCEIPLDSLGRIHRSSISLSLSLPLSLPPTPILQCL